MMVNMIKASYTLRMIKKHKPALVQISDLAFSGALLYSDTFIDTHL